MYVVTRASSSRLATSVSNFRSIATTSTNFAAAKGKAARAPAPKKKGQASFSKRPAAGGSKSGGGGSSSSVTLRYSEARPAVDISDWSRLHPEITTTSAVGTPTVFHAETFGKLKDFGLPRGLDRELAGLNDSASVIRQCTHDLAKRLDTARQGSAGSSGSVMLTGERGTGKSMLLLQTVAHALNSGWIVLYVPRCSEWINSSSSYTYHPPSQTFHQPALASSLLSKFLSVNIERLYQLGTQYSHQIDTEHVPEGRTIVDLIKMGTGVDAGKTAVPVLMAVMKELSAQTELPFLIALDEAQSLFTRSSYLTPHAQPIEAYDLAIPRLFLSYLSPSSSSAQMKGRIQTIASLSHSTPSFPPTITLLHTLGQPTGKHTITPYTRLEAGHQRYAQGIETYDVERLGAGEAAGMFQIYARKGWSESGDEPYLSSLITSGGNPLEFARGLSRTLSAL